MLGHFHFTALPPKKKTSPHHWVSFDEALTLPTVEDVDVFPSLERQETGELYRLEALGAEILTRIYNGETEAVTRINCKSITPDMYRI